MDRREFLAALIAVLTNKPKPTPDITRQLWPGQPPLCPVDTGTRTAEILTGFRQDQAGRFWAYWKQYGKHGIETEEIEIPREEAEPLDPMVMTFRANQ